MGNETKNFEARECIRIIDRLSKAQTLQDWIDIDNGEGGKLQIVLHKESEHSEANQVFGSKSNDHRILDAALKLQEDPSTLVTLVTKDINLRLKAKALELPAEDYKNGQVRDVKLGLPVRPSSKASTPTPSANFMSKVRRARLRCSTPTAEQPLLRSAQRIISALGYFSEATRSIERIDKTTPTASAPQRGASLRAARYHEPRRIAGDHLRCGRYGQDPTRARRRPRTAQPLRPNHPRPSHCCFVQPRHRLFARRCRGRSTLHAAPVGQPQFHQIPIRGKRRKSRVIEELKAEKKITICPLAYIRGRSLTNAIFIIDEAQNLTPHEVKTIITRAGENCKIILTGDVRQIDTPYLDEQSNGLSYVIDRLHEKDLYTHVTLEKGERSDLANLANTFL